MISLVDIWVKEDKLILLKHIRTTLQTSFLFLMVYALYLYFDKINTLNIQKDLPSFSRPKNVRI